MGDFRYNSRYITSMMQLNILEIVNVQIYGIRNVGHNIIYIYI